MIVYVKIQDNAKIILKEEYARETETAIALVDDYLKSVPGMEVSLSSTGCMGMCFAEPLVEVQDEHGSAVYGLLDEKSAVEVFQAHILQGNPLEKYIVKSETASCAGSGSSEDCLFLKISR